MGYDSAAGAGLKAAFDERVLDWPAVRSSVLFGYPAYRADETVFAVLETDGVSLARLSADSEDELRATDFETGPFEAYGQTIDAWVSVSATVDDLEALLPFVRRSYESARSGTSGVPPPDVH